MHHLNHDVIICYGNNQIRGTGHRELTGGKVTGKDIAVRKILFKAEKSFLWDVRKKVHFEKSSYSTRSTRYSEEEIWRKVEDFLADNRYITCSLMAFHFGLTKYVARQWLARFTEEGRLVKEGTPHQPMYFLK